MSIDRIVVERATKRYAAITVFERLELAVREGETLCVLGPSGCGKTTLLRAMHGLVPLDDGSVLIDGTRVSVPRRNVAMVFQHFGLFPWKRVDENVAYGIELAGLPRDQVRERVARYIELVGLVGFERHYPHQLSGGMQQRAGLARALATEPDILLMDEPFGSLDAQTREILQDELLRIYQRDPRTMVFITHAIEEAIALGDRVLVMTRRPGRVRELISVDIPRPRTVASVIAHPRFLALRDHCWRLLREQQVMA
ncbi:MAG: ABC transporter ATP-binding protein [Chloroflexi bacterium]|nr:MAG: ABC transporter ATP-binding protein [Chloroflexota bacterium]TMB96199.1 MAG: ABC transporter ATP-binding protein [Chloroflexota bacterium]TMC33703.1 MAG: ABC transporter ATP-binding protein [Chloroflexota bacterium]TMC58231.1 MAG: ABC transporter ATP-binding protein [Chloroflexota bacterium]TME37467.1 MAG: ABC transporter ATP-binding protein [Chloroflexota bacterium]